MKVSVILTTYTNENVVSKSIEAIFSQTLPADLYEVVVIDDASRDGTYQVLQELSVKFPFTLLINETNKGSAYSRNRAAKEAKNELLIFVQDDIIVEKDFLQKHYDAHVSKNDEKIVVVGYTYWHADVKMTPFMDYLDKGQQFDYLRFQNVSPDEDGLIEADHLLFYTSNMSIRQSFFISVGGLDEEFMAPGIAAYDDTEFSWRLKKAGMKIYYAPNARAGHLHQRTLESLCKRKFAEGYLSLKLHQKHPDFSWNGSTSSLSYNLSHLKFGALFSRFRFFLIVITTIVVNPLVIAVIEPIAKKVQYTKNVPILYKLVLGYYFNKGYWSGVIRKGTIRP